MAHIINPIDIKPRNVIKQTQIKLSCMCSPNKKEHINKSIDLTKEQAEALKVQAIIKKI